MRQISFNPIDYAFEWTDNGCLWDSVLGRREALRARNAKAKALVKEGRKVRRSSFRNQLVSRGGIGSGRPHIKTHANVYVVEVLD